MQHIQSLINKITDNNPLQTSFFKKVFTLLTEEEKNEFDNYIKYCCSSGKGIDFLSQSYNQLLKDTLKEQFFFKRNNKYRYSKFSEVKKCIYDNENYMDMYMYGLAISSFLWHQHILIRRYFEKTIPKDNKGKYLEIGPGHGYYFASAMQKTSYNFFTGIDISKASVQNTCNILEYRFRNKYNNYEIIEADFLTYKINDKFEAIIIGEVLEHVENPDLLLKKVSKTANFDTYIFLTTCINAPMIDHIYLFRTIDEVDDLITNSGLGIVDKLYAPCLGETFESSMDKQLPLNVAYQLTIL